MTRDGVFMLRPKAGGFTPAFTLIGFTAVIAQVVLMRELVVVFHGSELALGLVLASWFFWTALGSSLFGRVAAGSRDPRALMACLQGSIAPAFPLGILAARLSRSAIKAIPGEILGPGSMLLVSLAVLSLFCVVSGGLFAAGSRFLGTRTSSTAGEATASLYLLEAVGSGIGGLLASMVLIRFLAPFEIAALLAALNLGSAVFLAFRSPAGRSAATAALLALFVVSLTTSAAKNLELLSLRPLWKGFDLLTTRNSIYGNLAVAATEGNRSVFENGLVVATAPDPAGAEEAVHYALLQHAEPKRLLLVGGGINGSLAQALGYAGLSRVEYVELDPAICDLARGYFPEWKAAEGDPRAHVHNVDGRLFLKSAPCRYDLIIVNLPEPQTAQLNRFYTLEFFREAAGQLDEGGVFSFQVAGSEDYISPALAEFLRCINKTLRAAFRDVAVLPGDPVHFFASKRAGSLTSDPALLVARLRSRRLQTRYVREYYIPFRMAPDRLQDLDTNIQPRPDTPVNRDFSPIAYYFDIAYWSARFAPGRRQWFQSLARIPFGTVAAVSGGLMFCPCLLMGLSVSGIRRRKASAGLGVAVMGFTLIALEILLLLGFQSLYGYVYHGLALLIAAFMVGMAAGSWFALRQGPGSLDSSGVRRDMRALALLQAIAALTPILIVCLFDLLARIQGGVGLMLVSQVVFPALALACGFIGGSQFPMASRIYFPGSGPAAANPGTLYALDLAGSCLGAVILSVYLIPVFGFLKTALLLGLINLAPALLLAHRRDAEFLFTIRRG